MKAEEIINLLRTAIELAGDGGPAAFTEEEYAEMYKFLDKLEELSPILEDDARPFPKI